MSPAAVVLVLAGLFEPSPTGVAVSAVYVAPARAGVEGAVEVTLSPSDPDVHVNQDPAPRLTLDAAQSILVNKPAPKPAKGAASSGDVGESKYLDPAVPVKFPAALVAAAPKGRQTVKASVTYFYCSKREGWCKKGTSEVDVPVDVK